ncbi:SMYD3 protein [Pseudoscourfieldia marina]
MSADASFVASLPPPPCADPWLNVPAAVELSRLETEEEITKAALTEATAASFSAAAEAVLSAKGAGSPPTAASLVASELNLSGEIKLSDVLRGCLLSLDLSENSLEDADVLAGDGWCWLRELKLSSNKLKRWPSSLKCMPALISLDLSFNARLSLNGANLRPLSGLMKLELAGLGLTNLTGADGDDDDDDDDEREPDPKAPIPSTPLSALVSLIELNISENDIETLVALAPLRALPSLQRLDASGNPVADNGRYKRSVQSLVPRLKQLDGDNLSTLTGASKHAGAVKDADSGTSAVFESNRDTSTCSCLEGNPCVEPLCCKNWKQRYFVAHEARKRKGMFEPKGLA